MRRFVPRAEFLWKLLTSVFDWGNRSAWPASSALLAIVALSAEASHAAQIPLSAALASVAPVKLGNYTLVESVPEPDPEPPKPPKPPKKDRDSKTDSAPTRGRDAWCPLRFSVNPPTMAEELGSVIEGLFTLSLPRTARFGKKSRTRCLLENR